MFGGKRLFEMDALRINFLPFLRPWLRALFSKIANFIPDKWECFGLPIDELEFVGRKVVE